MVILPNLVNLTWTKLDIIKSLIYYHCINRKKGDYTMSIIKSFSVGDGDTFYIKHNSDNFSIIDCCLSEDNKEKIVDEMIEAAKNIGISRFLSTHPDNDHICGLEYLDEKMGIVNFYCVKNETTKADETDDFKKYCDLRDSKKAFYLEKGCSRRWMNQSDKDRGCAGINILWPDINNKEYKSALESAKKGDDPNNISPIIKYSIVNNGPVIIWMGDILKDFLEKIKDELELPNADIVFAPHHGRSSGKIPKELLDKLKPKVIIIGEGPSEDLDYYKGYDTITQNTAGDITLECLDDKIHIYVSDDKYKVDFLDDEKANSYKHYIGTLNLK